VLMSKIIFFLKYYFDIFPIKKYFKKQLLAQYQTSSFHGDTVESKLHQQESLILDDQKKQLLSLFFL